MSYSLNTLKGGYIGDCIGSIIGVIKGDARSLDNGSCGLRKVCLWGGGRRFLKQGTFRIYGGYTGLRGLVSVVCGAPFAR